MTSQPELPAERHADAVAERRADSVVAEAGRAASGAARSLARASDKALETALGAMSDRLTAAHAALAEANQRDVGRAEAVGMSAALLDRLRLDAARLEGMATQLRLLSAASAPERDVPLGELPGNLRLIERRRPVGVIGANFEARPNVVVDVASQLVKSRNAGVLRTGSAALTTALALHQQVIAPGLADAGLDPAAIQLIGEPDRRFAAALVRQPGLIPLVILRGSGDTTRSLAAEAARHGVRTLAHADGGGVLFVDAAADVDLAVRLAVAGVDRLGVCNRVNLVLVAEAVYERAVPALREALTDAGLRVSLPPHDHPLGHEWALDVGNEATVTVAPVGDAVEAAEVANRETSGLAATIVTADERAATEFLDAYAGTGGFWNATTRLLDGFKLHGVPETGINVDHVPGPRGPVTFRDLYLRQYLVLPARPT